MNGSESKGVLARECETAHTNEQTEHQQQQQ